MGASVRIASVCALQLNADTYVHIEHVCMHAAHLLFRLMRESPGLNPADHPQPLPHQESATHGMPKLSNTSIFDARHIDLTAASLGVGKWTNKQQ